MKLIVNGSVRECSEPLSLAALLEQLDMTGKRVAVERNGSIVPRSLHAQTELADGDSLEIVVAVGGG